MTKRESASKLPVSIEAPQTYGQVRVFMSIVEVGVMYKASLYIEATYYQPLLSRHSKILVTNYTPDPCPLQLAGFGSYNLGAGRQSGR